MSDADLAAARLLERLLTEPDFRVRFRRDPVTACREAGLDELAEDMALAAGKAANTLYVRESRSSMAGALIAASMEGAGGLHDLADQVDIASMPPAVGNVLTLHLMSVKADVNPNIEFAAGAERKFSDPRVVEVLNKLAEEHKLTVSGSSDGGVDISAIDGQPVGVANFDAREVAMRLQDLDPSIRPDEIGTPWAIDGRGYFTDAGHKDVLHIGFDKHASMQLMAVADAHKAAPPVPVDAIDYPGDDASREQIAAWMAAAAEKRGLPGQLPVMASLVESGMHNLSGGDRDSVGVLPDARRDLELGAVRGLSGRPAEADRLVPRPGGDRQEGPHRARAAGRRPAPVRRVDRRRRAPGRAVPGPLPAPARGGPGAAQGARAGTGRGCACTGGAVGPGRSGAVRRRGHRRPAERGDAGAAPEPQRRL